MRNGMPIICTYESGSVINHLEDGIVIKAADEGLFSYYLSKLISHPHFASKISLNAIKTSSGFTWESYASRINAIYDCFK